MTFESLPEKGWGRVRERCKNCPRAVSTDGERYCEHPWRRIIAVALATDELVTYQHIASAWDMGATIGRPIDGPSRPSIEVSEVELKPTTGTTVFRIN